MKSASQALHESTHLICPGKCMCLRHACRDKFARTTHLSGQIVVSRSTTRLPCSSSWKFLGMFQPGFHCTRGLAFLVENEFVRTNQPSITYVCSDKSTQPNVSYVHVQRCYPCSVANCFLAVEIATFNRAWEALLFSWKMNLSRQINRQLLMFVRTNARNQMCRVHVQRCYPCSVANCFLAVEIATFNCAWEALLFSWKMNLSGQINRQFLMFVDKTTQPMCCMCVQLQHCHP